MLLFWFLYTLHRLVKHSVQFFLNLQFQSKWSHTSLMAYHHLYGINILFSSLTLNGLTCLSLNVYPLILVNIKNGLLTLSKYRIKYLKLIFVSTYFEMTISLTSTSQIFIRSFLHHKVLLSLHLSHQISTLVYYQKKKSLFFS